MGRLRLATVWLGGCSGCHMSFLDLDEFLFDLADRVDVVYSPFIDAKEYPEGVDVVLVEGAIANVEHLEMIRRVRERTQDADLVRRLRRDGQRHRAAQRLWAAPNPCSGASYLENGDLDRADSRGGRHRACRCSIA